ncbi:MAG: universal stress protein [Dehalococcoidia bacterium]
MYRRILVTLDGSTLARTALAHAAKLASGSSTEVRLLAVTDTPAQTRREAEEQFELTDGDSARIDALGQELHFNRRHRALDELARAEQELRTAGVATVQGEVVEGLAGNEIVNFATAQQCDAIVMATRGHGGLGREVLGSVAEYVLRHAGDVAVVLVGPRASS